MKKVKGTPLAKWQTTLAECAECGYDKVTTVDHIVPSHVLLQLVSIEATYEWEDNFQHLCPYCNRRKGSQLDVRHPQTYKILRRALDMAEEANKNFMRKQE